LSISFESSLLSRIESSAFARTRLHFVLLPESLLFIAGDAFPCSCDVCFANVEPCRELAEWNDGREFGSVLAFKWSVSW
jgi:hypothetical protein